MTKDYFEAYLWLNLAATSGPPQLVKLRNAADAKLTPSQIAEAQRLAREWKGAAPIEEPAEDYHQPSG